MIIRSLFLIIPLIFLQSFTCYGMQMIEYAKIPEVENFRQALVVHQNSPVKKLQQALACGKILASKFFALLPALPGYDGVVDLFFDLIFYPVEEIIVSDGYARSLQYWDQRSIVEKQSEKFHKMLYHALREALMERMEQAIDISHEHSYQRFEIFQTVYLWSQRNSLEVCRMSKSTEALYSYGIYCNHLFHGRWVAERLSVVTMLRVVNDALAAPARLMGGADEQLRGVGRSCIQMFFNGFTENYEQREQKEVSAESTQAALNRLVDLARLWANNENSIQVKEAALKKYGIL